MELKEIWRPVIIKTDEGEIIDFSGYYEVSNTKKIKRINCFKQSRWGGLIPIQATYLKLDVTNKGYNRVSLFKEGEKFRFGFHRIVAFAFPEICGEWFPGAVVNHKDCTPGNDIPENLEWCTVQYNSEYMHHMRGVNLNRKDLSKPIIQLTKEGQFVKRWDSIKEAERSGVASKQNIMRVLRKKPGSKLAAGYKWVYESDYLT